MKYSKGQVMFVTKNLSYARILDNVPYSASNSILGTGPYPKTFEGTGK